MLMRIAQWLIIFLLPDLRDDDLRLLCIYGCEVWLYTVLSTLGLLMIGLLTNSVLETIIIITIFYLCQTNGGGFHATTHLRCFLTMTLGLLIGLMFVRLPIFRSVIPYTCFLSLYYWHARFSFIQIKNTYWRIVAYCAFVHIV